MKKNQRWWVAVWAIWYASQVMATEIDSFTDRFPLSHDETLRLDEMTKERIEEVLEEENLANKEKREGGEQIFCDDLSLLKSIRKRFGGALWGNFENEVTNDSHFDLRSITRSQSIYSGLSVYDSFPLYMVHLGKTFHINGYVIGTDKLGHFFEEGWVQFSKAFEEGGGWEAGLNYGRQTERGLFGAQTTGVYSYADTVANFSGMLFYYYLTPRWLPENEKDQSYLECRDGLWSIRHLPSWGEIIHSGFDEGQNCNHYASKSIEKKIEKKIQALEELHKRSYQCPLDIHLCQKDKQALLEKYPFSDQLFSPQCL